MATSAAVIGLGPHGRRLVDALVATPGVELSAVVDSRPEALAAVSVPAGATRLSSADALWSARPMDLVCVTTNGPSHAELTLQAMAWGARRVLVEKPMACSVAECDRMIAEARRRD